MRFGGQWDLATGPAWAHTICGLTSTQLRQTKVQLECALETVPQVRLAPTWSGQRLAERAADLIRGRDPMVIDDAPLPVDPEWKTRQRSQEISLDLATSGGTDESFFDLG